MSSASKDIWKTLNEAKRKQDEIRSRLSSYESDSDDEEEEDRWVQRTTDRRSQEQRPPPQEQAPKKKPAPPPPPPPSKAKASAPAPAPAPPRNPSDPRRVDFDSDSEPDYYGFNDSSSDEEDVSKPRSDPQVKRNSSKPMTAEEAVNLVKGLRKDDDLDISESNNEDSQRHMMNQQQKQRSQRRTSSDEKDDSSSPMTAEEAIKLCMNQNRDDGAVQSSNFDYNEDDDSDNGNAGGYFDDDDVNENSFANRNSSNYNTSSAADGRSGASSKWKKSKGDNTNMADWGNTSDTTFATTFTSTQKAQKYGLYNQDDDTDHDDDEGFYDALQDPLDDGSYDRFTTSDGTKRKSLSSVKEEGEEDEGNRSVGSSGSKSRKKQDGENNWGRRLSNMAMGVFNNKDGGDIEEGGQGGNRRSSAGGGGGSMNPFQALSSTVNMASSVMANIGNSMNTSGGEEGGDNGGGGQGMAANMMNVFGRKPKNPPKQLNAPSRELEIIRKCQEQMKQREIEAREKEANAAKEDLENLRLRKEEEDARRIVKDEVERYRQTMIDMGNEDKLAKEGKAAADEYDDRLAMEDTLKEQEAKAKLMQENMQQIDKAGEDSDSDSDSDDEEDEGGCCSRLCGCFCCLLKYPCVLIILIVLVGVPLYFFSNSLEKIPYFSDYVPSWDEVRGSGDDGAENATPLASDINGLSNLTQTIVPTMLLTDPPTPVPTLSPTEIPVTPTPTALPTNTTNLTIADEVDISDLFEDPQRSSIAGSTNDQDEPEEDPNPDKDAKPDKAKPENRYLRRRLKGKK